jgi:hypothetical protein
MNLISHDSRPHSNVRPAARKTAGPRTGNIRRASSRVKGKIICAGVLRSTLISPGSFPVFHITVTTGRKNGAKTPRAHAAW